MGCRLRAFRDQSRVWRLQVAPPFRRLSGRASPPAAPVAQPSEKDLPAAGRFSLRLRHGKSLTAENAEIAKIAENICASLRSSRPLGDLSLGDLCGSML